MMFHNVQRRKILVVSVYTAFTSQETFSKLWIIRGMSIVKKKNSGEGYLKREDIMQVEGMFLVVSLNVRCHDVTKYV